VEGDTVAVADVEMLLQPKLSSSSPSNVSRVSRAHLPSILQPLYEEVYKGGGGAVPSWGWIAFGPACRCQYAPLPIIQLVPGEFQATSRKNSNKRSSNVVYFHVQSSVLSVHLL
jgi:hypothetical protein